MKNSPTRIAKAVKLLKELGLVTTVAPLVLQVEAVPEGVRLATEPACIYSDLETLFAAKGWTVPPLIVFGSDTPAAPDLPC